MLFGCKIAVLVDDAALSVLIKKICLDAGATLRQWNKKSLALSSDYNLGDTVFNGSFYSLTFLNLFDVIHSGHNSG